MEQLGFDYLLGSEIDVPFILPPLECGPAVAVRGVLTQLDTGVELRLFPQVPAKETIYPSIWIEFYDHQVKLYAYANPEGDDPTHIIDFTPLIKSLAVQP